MASISRSKVQGFILIVVILILGVMYLNFVMPKLAERDQKQVQLAEKEQQLQQLKMQLAAVGQINAKDATAIADVRRAIPEEPNVELLLRHLRMLEVVSGLPMSTYSFNFGQAKTEKASAGKKPAENNAEANDAAQAALAALVVPVEMNFSVKGSYDKISRLISEIQTSERLMEVDNLTFTQTVAPPVQVHRSNQAVEASFKLVSYYAPGMKVYFKTPIPVDAETPLGRSNPLN